MDSRPLVVVVGGANVDVKARSTAPLATGTSNPGTVVRSPGGVGRNVAENLGRLGSRVALLSVVGSDDDGDWLVQETARGGVDVGPVLRGGRTGRYVAVLDDGGELVAGVSDMAATEAITPDALDLDLLRAAALVVLDGNLPVPTLDAVLALGCRVAVDPVSVPKARRMAPLLRPERAVALVTPNADELAALCPLGPGPVEALHALGVEAVWVRRGPAGSLLSVRGRPAVELAAPAVVPVDVTGAGDAMLAACCHAWLGGAPLAEAAAQGHRAAALTVASPHTVVPDLAARMVR